MMPDVYWIRDIEPLRFAMMPRPRGREWLEDEVSGWKQLGVDLVVSLLHPYEAKELEISEEERMCVSRGIGYRSFPSGTECGRLPWFERGGARLVAVREAHHVVQEPHWRSRGSQSRAIDFVY